MRTLIATLALALPMVIGASGCSSDATHGPGHVAQSLDVFFRDQCPGFRLVSDPDGGVERAEYDDPWAYDGPRDDAGTSTWTNGLCPDGGENSLHPSEHDYGTPTAAQCDRVKFFQPIPRNYSAADGGGPVPLANDVQRSDTVCFGFGFAIDAFLKVNPYRCYALTMYFEGATATATTKVWDPADPENLDIWSTCKNKLFVRCAMAGLLHYRSPDGSVDKRITKIRWVTLPKDFLPTRPPMGAVTGREMCEWARVSRGDLPGANSSDTTKWKLYQQGDPEVQF